ncbi:MAG: hypothetical protein MPL62_03210 [Alphaproteobacteria bacterium]|nr:hypothetical protein [Alphaproteobacteria bacterium]
MRTGRDPRPHFFALCVRAGAGVTLAHGLCLTLPLLDPQGVALGISGRLTKTFTMLAQANRTH